MNINTKTAVALAAGAVLVAAAGAGVMYAVQDKPADGQAQVAPVKMPPATPGRPLEPGKYDFNILGGNTVKVTLDPCGPDCLILKSPPTQTNPDGFARELRKRGNTFSGKAAEPTGIICAVDGSPRPAEVEYTVRGDGTAGMVAVLGEPCGPGQPNVPLGFTLTPSAA